MKEKRGYAALVLVFLLGLIGVLLSLSLIHSGYIESISGRAGASSDQAFYAAQSGTEEALAKIKENNAYTANESLLTIGNATAKVTVTGDTTAKTIISIGTSGHYVRRMQMEVQNTSTESGFDYAVEAFAGGFELANNARVTKGDVYSEGDIMGGSSNNNCNSNASIIEEVATTLSSFSPYAGGNGVCVYKDAYANMFTNCYIKGRTFYKTTAPILSTCPYVPPAISIASIDPVEPPLPDTFIDATVNNLGDPNSVPPANCVVGGFPDCSTIVNGTPTIGSQIIHGDLQINSNTINFSGPVYVTGNLTIASQTSVSLSDLISCTDSSCISQLLVVDGRIIVNAHMTFVPKVSFSGTNKAYVLPISRYNPWEHGLPSSKDSCFDSSKISIMTESNISNVLFYAPHGCLWIKNTGSAKYTGGASAEKVHLVKGTLEYDPGLRDAVFGSTPHGGWKISNFNQD